MFAYFCPFNYNTFRQRHINTLLLMRHVFKVLLHFAILYLFLLTMFDKRKPFTETRVNKNKITG